MIHKTKNKAHKAVLLAISIFIIAAFFRYPDYFIDTLREADYGSILLILFYLPGFLVLMGLFEVWLPKEFVVEHLGKHSGIRGTTYSFLAGALIPGPLYVAFPFAATLLKKGVSIFNISVFLGAWSCFKIGEEIFEMQFLGGRFLILRILITLPFIFLISYLIDKGMNLDKSL